MEFSIFLCYNLDYEKGVFMKKRILIFSSIFLILDQLIKIVVRNNITLDKEISIIPKFFYITNVKNTGGAFSMFAGSTIALAIIGSIVILFLVHYLDYAKTSLFEDICYSILAGGVIGNMIDRILYNGVTDYLGFIIYKYNFPVFNLADIGIVVSIFLLIIIEFRSEKHGNRSSK